MLKSKLLVLLFTCLTPLCGSAVELLLWNAHSLEHLRPIVLERFEKKTGHHIVQHHFRADELRDKVMSSVVLPDLYFMPSDQLSNVDIYHLAPWPDSVTQGQPLRADGQVGTKWYGIPVNQGNQLVLYYRKDKVTPPKSLESIPDGRLGWPRSQAYWFIPFLTAHDGWPLAGEGFGFDTPQMIKALESYKAISDRHPATRCELTCNEQAFYEGKIDYLIDGDWAFQALKEQLEGKLGVAVLPSLDGGQMQPMSSSYVLAMSQGLDSEKQAAAQALAHFLLSPEVQADLYQHSGLFPGIKSVGDALLPQMGDLRKGLYQQLLVSRPMPNSRQMLIAWLVLGKGMEMLFNEEYLPDEIAQWMQQRAAQEVTPR
ncbi:sugar ABC transporter substrate-binding protein [Pseudaeromonas paramecii]|uniref:Extracellular solute-binding protein n=1 Tax=Pseudaeromonas paramecii TaxID=2138166 RepID=A0ABP8PUL5_9GAMM